MTYEGSGSRKAIFMSSLVRLASSWPRYLLTEIAQSLQTCLAFTKSLGQRKLKINLSTCGKSLLYSKNIVQCEPSILHPTNCDHYFAWRFNRNWHRMFHICGRGLGSAQRISGRLLSMLSFESGCGSISPHLWAIPNLSKQEGSEKWHCIVEKNSTNDFKTLPNL